MHIFSYIYRKVFLIFLDNLLKVTTNYQQYENCLTIHEGLTIALESQNNLLHQIESHWLHINIEYFKEGQIAFVELDR
jgi:hypothetical protein